MNAMKRSEVNALMREAESFLEEQKFYLPEFAFWSLEEWQKKGQEVREIIDNQLGWDITDFGSGEFSKFGLILFTIRNGNFERLNEGGKPYCEKIMIVEEEQVTPMHHHFQKAEDIINRGGGILMVQVYAVSEEEDLAETLVKVSTDGTERIVDAGHIFELEPGESITITSDIYHKFWAKKGFGKLLIGEVSSVNDDRVDNKFLEGIGRFSEIEEDEPPLYLLYQDYDKFLSIK